MTKFLTIDLEFSHAHGLNLSESLLLGFYATSGAWCNAVDFGGRLMFYVSKTLVTKMLPLLTDKPDTVYKLTKSLEKKGLIYYVKQGQKDLISLTESGQLWGQNCTIPTLGKKSEFFEPEKLGKLSEKKAQNSENNPKSLGKKSDIVKSNISKSIIISNSILGDKENFESDFDLDFTLQPDEPANDVPFNFEPLNAEKKEKKKSCAKKEKPEAQNLPAVELESDGTTKDTTQGPKTSPRAPQVAKNKTRGTFTPPELHEVENYMLTLTQNDQPRAQLQAQKFHNRNTAIGWKVGKHDMKDWKAAARTWIDNDTQWSRERAATQYGNGQAVTVHGEILRPLTRQEQYEFMNLAKK